MQEQLTLLFMVSATGTLRIANLIDPFNMETFHGDVHSVSR